MATEPRRTASVDPRVRKEVTQVQCHRDGVLVSGVDPLDHPGIRPRADEHPAIRTMRLRNRRRSREPPLILPGENHGSRRGLAVDELPTGSAISTHINPPRHRRASRRLPQTASRVEKTVGRDEAGHRSYRTEFGGLRPIQVTRGPGVESRTEGCGNLREPADQRLTEHHRSSCERSVSFVTKCDDECPCGSNSAHPYTCGCVAEDAHDSIHGSGQSPPKGFSKSCA